MAAKNQFHALTWQDIENWSGGAVLDRGKRSLDQVTYLALAPNDQLVAKVEGHKRYLTEVWLDHGNLHSRCSCPYLGTCKHAVAVVLKYLENIKSGQPVLEISPEEFAAFIEVHEPVDRTDDEINRSIDPEIVRAALAAIPAEDLVEWAANAIADHAELWSTLPHDLQLTVATPEKQEVSEKTIARLRHQIRLVAEQRFYRNDWDYGYENDDDMPDYWPIQQEFGNLLDAGQTDILIELGKELFFLGSAQIEESYDDGQIADELAECMKLVVEAMQKSGKSAAHRIIDFWDLEIEDSCSLLYNIALPIEEGEMNQKDWVQVAEEFKRRLEPPEHQKADDWMTVHRRNRFLKRAVEAFANAKENKQAIELLIADLPHCQNHVQLVDFLLKIGDNDLAGQWAVEGLRQTVDNQYHDSIRLAEQLREVEIRKENWPMVVAIEIEFFLKDPVLGTYQRVREACVKTEHWDQVRPMLLNYAQTGDSVYSDANWPLPDTDVRFPKSEYQDFPCWNTLVAIALDEKNLDDAVRHYREAPPNQMHVSSELAIAVAKTHPDVAVEIWKDEAESLINTVQVSAYREAMHPLSKMEKLLKELDREDDYQAYIAELRKHHKLKRKLMEQLNFQEQRHRKILDE